MYKPAGGIWVPIGYCTWQFSVKADYDSNGGVWSVTSIPPSSTGFIASQSYSGWDDSIQHLLTSYGWVQTSP